MIPGGAEQVDSEVMLGPEWFTALGTGSSAGPGLSHTWACSHGRCRGRNSCLPLHRLATALLRCVPRPCCSSSACTRRSSCESMWRNLPSTTCSSWSTPTRRQCCLEPTRTQVQCRFIRCVLSTCYVLGSGLDPGDSWIKAEPCLACWGSLQPDSNNRNQPARDGKTEGLQEPRGAPDLACVVRKRILEKGTLG